MTSSSTPPRPSVARRSLPATRTFTDRHERFWKEPASLGGGTLPFATASSDRRRGTTRSCRLHHAWAGAWLVVSSSWWATPNATIRTQMRKTRGVPPPTTYLEIEAPTLAAVGVGARTPPGDSRSQQRRGFPTSGGHGGVEVRLSIPGGRPAFNCCIDQGLGFLLSQASRRADSVTDVLLGHHPSHLTPRCLCVQVHYMQPQQSEMFVLNDDRERQVEMSPFLWRKHTPPSLNLHFQTDLRNRAQTPLYEASLGHGELASVSRVARCGSRCVSVWKAATSMRREQCDGREGGSGERRSGRQGAVEGKAELEGSSLTHRT